MLSAKIRRRLYVNTAVALVVTILAGVIAPPGSVSADAAVTIYPEAAVLTSHNPVGLMSVAPMSMSSVTEPLSLVPDMLNSENLAENLNLPSELTDIVPKLGPDGESVGFLMDAGALQQQAAFEPVALAEPISLSRVQSTYVAGGGVTGTLVLTLTVSNNLSPAINPNLPVSATITDTIEAVSAIDFSNDPNVVRNVVIADRLTASAVWLDADPLPDRKDDQFIWNLGDVPPLSTVTATLRLEVPGSVADFADLDTGAIAYGTLQGRIVSANTASATLAPEEYAQWLVWTVDADYYDEYAVDKAAELGNDWEQIFAYVRSLGYESYKGSLRGTRGTLNAYEVELC